LLTVPVPFTNVVLATNVSAETPGQSLVPSLQTPPITWNAPVEVLKSTTAEPLVPPFVPVPNRSYVPSAEAEPVTVMVSTVIPLPVITQLAPGQLVVVMVPGDAAPEKSIKIVAEAGLTITIKARIPARIPMRFISCVFLLF
jgi:hypothetical protein